MTLAITSTTPLDPASNGDASGGRPGGRMSPSLPGPGIALGAGIGTVGGTVLAMLVPLPAGEGMNTEASVGAALGIIIGSALAANRLSGPDRPGGGGPR